MQKFAHDECEIMNEVIDKFAILNIIPINILLIYLLIPINIPIKQFSPHHIKTSHCNANQLTGFYMWGLMVVNGLMRSDFKIQFFLHKFFRIFPNLLQCKLWSADLVKIGKLMQQNNNFDSHFLL